MGAVLPMNRNTTPPDAFDTLRRIYACNWEQLADRLGVSSATLRTWRKEGPGTNGKLRMADLFRTAIRAANADWLNR